ncbi:MAG: capsular biosynthesis protein [Lachnospiraceae bacterium]|nr:capsular biosynthesis protein [Lachnospiraceae bacterium]
MEQIDFVVTWVDGQDKAWRKEKAQYAHEGKSADDSEERYRDWEFLRFWFRGVENFAPWVRKVHFITWGHLPKWLNTKHPKLHIVRHEDYIPKEFLPVFNSNVLEIYMYRIDGLSEQFVYFNDDMFLTKKVGPEMFFMGGKPCDMLAFQPVVANPANPVMSHLFMNNTLVLAKYFDKRENVRKHPGDYFKVGYPALYFFYNILEMAFPLYTGFYTVHGHFPFLKSTFEEVWEKEGNALRQMSVNRFRSQGDLTLYLFREWQKLTGNFHAKNMHKGFSYYNLSEAYEKAEAAIRRQKVKMVCLNDGNVGGNFAKIKEKIQQAFMCILPEPCSFEQDRETFGHGEEVL